MLPFRPLITAMLILCAAPVRAISFDCVPPVFPARPVTHDELRRIEQQVRAWNVCYAAFSATQRSIDATRQDHEVATELAKWSATMRGDQAITVARAGANAPDRRRLDEMMLRQAERQPAVYSRDRR